MGFSASEASALKIKAEILSAILEHIRAEGYTQAQLIAILDEYQPSVSNLLRGRIAQVSIEKLLRYADRLHLQTSIAVAQWNRNRAARGPVARPAARPSLGEWLSRFSTHFSRPLRIVELGLLAGCPGGLPAPGGSLYLEFRVARRL